MKIRIQGDSIRLRLTVSEVAAVGRGEPVEETTRFGVGRPFSYRLLPCAAIDEVRATHENGSIDIRIPEALGSRWAADEAFVSIMEATVAPRVLIEKDFACLEPRPGDDRSDSFANPNARCG